VDKNVIFNLEKDVDMYPIWERLVKARINLNEEFRKIVSRLRELFDFV